jgi:hypothetical protein
MSIRHRRRIRKAIARQGQPVELTLYEVVESETQNATLSEELTTLETKAIVDTGGNVESQIEWDLSISDVETDVVVYLRDDVTEGVRVENQDGDMVRPVITSVDTVIDSAATEMELLNSGPSNRNRTFRFNQAHEWADAGCIVASATIPTSN